LIHWAPVSAACSYPCPLISPPSGLFDSYPYLYFLLLGLPPIAPILAIISNPRVFWSAAGFIPPPSALPLGCLYAQFYLVQLSPNLHSIYNMLIYFNNILTSGCILRHFSPNVHFGKNSHTSLGWWYGHSSSVFLQLGKCLHFMRFFSSTSCNSIYFYLMLFLWLLKSIRVFPLEGSNLISSRILLLLLLCFWLKTLGAYLILLWISSSLYPPYYPLFTPSFLIKVSRSISKWEAPFVLCLSFAGRFFNLSKTSFSVLLLLCLVSVRLALISFLCLSSVIILFGWAAAYTILTLVVWILSPITFYVEFVAS